VDAVCIEYTTSYLRERAVIMELHGIWASTQKNHCSFRKKSKVMQFHPIFVEHSCKTIFPNPAEIAACNGDEPDSTGAMWYLVSQRSLGKEALRGKKQTVKAYEWCRNLLGNSRGWFHDANLTQNGANNKYLSTEANALFAIVMVPLSCFHISY
jgi:hypothetical protein